MNWLEYKLFVESKGVKDNDVIWFIDVTHPTNDAERIDKEFAVWKDPKLGIVISN
jgi:hypothetical protein